MENFERGPVWENYQIALNTFTNAQYRYLRNQSLEDEWRNNPEFSTAGIYGDYAYLEHCRNQYNQALQAWLAYEVGLMPTATTNPAEREARKWSLFKLANNELIGKGINTLERRRMGFFERVVSRFKRTPRWIKTLGTIGAFTGAAMLTGGSSIGAAILTPGLWAKVAVGLGSGYIARGILPKILFMRNDLKKLERQLNSLRVSGGDVSTDIHALENKREAYLNYIRRHERTKDIKGAVVFAGSIAAAAGAASLVNTGAVNAAVNNSLQNSGNWFTNMYNKITTGINNFFNPGSANSVSVPQASTGPQIPSASTGPQIPSMPSTPSASGFSGISDSFDDIYQTAIVDNSINQNFTFNGDSVYNIDFGDTTTIINNYNGAGPSPLEGINLEFPEINSEPFNVSESLSYTGSPVEELGKGVESLSIPSAESFAQSFSIKADSAQGLWGPLVKNTVPEIVKTFDPSFNLTPAHSAWIGDTFWQEVVKNNTILTPAQWKELGILSGDPSIVQAGTSINITELCQKAGINYEQWFNNHIQQAKNLSPESLNRITMALKRSGGGYISK